MLLNIFVDWRTLRPAECWPVTPIQCQASTVTHFENLTATMRANATGMSCENSAFTQHSLDVAHCKPCKHVFSSQRVMSGAFGPDMRLVFQDAAGNQKQTNTQTHTINNQKNPTKNTPIYHQIASSKYFSVISCSAIQSLQRLQSGPNKKKKNRVECLDCSVMSFHGISVARLFQFVFARHARHG